MSAIRMKWTSVEIQELQCLLDSYDALSDQEIEIVARLRRKLEKAQTYSLTNRRKYNAILRAGYWKRDPLPQEAAER